MIDKQFIVPTNDSPIWLADLFYRTEQKTFDLCAYEVEETHSYFWVFYVYDNALSEYFLKEEFGTYAECMKHAREIGYL